MEEMNMNDWLPNQEMNSTLEEMDQLVLKLKCARESYDAAKKASNLEHAKLEEIKKEVINTLKANGRSKYESEGVASIRVQVKEEYTTPKTNEAKRLLYKYIQDTYGVDTCTSMLSIHSATLNAWANRESEAHPELQIPGLDAPTSSETLVFTTKK